MADNWKPIQDVGEDNWKPIHDVNLPRPEPVSQGWDLPKSLKAGIEEMPGGVVGFSDLPYALTMGIRPGEAVTNWIGEKTGFQPGKWAKDTKFSPEYRDSQDDIASAWKDPNANGLDVAKAYLRNPMYLANQTVRSAPSMFAGGGISKGLGLVGDVAQALGHWASPVLGAAGEGIVQAGQAMDQYEGDDARKGAIAAIGSGGIDALIAGVGGRLAHKMGFETPQTSMAGGLATGFESQASRAKRMVGGALMEGAGQEFPQSIQEQMWQNYADNKPLGEGALQAGVEGGLSGFAMGGLFNMRRAKGLALPALPAPPTDPGAPAATQPYNLLTDAGGPEDFGKRVQQRWGLQPSQMGEQDPNRLKSQKDYEAWMAEPSGRTVADPATGVERVLTNGELADMQSGVSTNGVPPTYQQDANGNWVPTSPQQNAGPTQQPTAQPAPATVQPAAGPITPAPAAAPVAPTEQTPQDPAMAAATAATASPAHHDTLAAEARYHESLKRAHDVLFTPEERAAAGGNTQAPANVLTSVMGLNRALDNGLVNPQEHSDLLGDIRGALQHQNKALISASVAAANNAVSKAKSAAEQAAKIAAKDAEREAAAKKSMAEETKPNPPPKAPNETVGTSTKTDAGAKTSSEKTASKPATTSATAEAGASQSAGATKSEPVASESAPSVLPNVPAPVVTKKKGPRLVRAGTQAALAGEKAAAAAAKVEETKTEAAPAAAPAAAEAAVSEEEAAYAAMKDKRRKRRENAEAVAQGKPVPHPDVPTNLNAGPINSEDMADAVLEAKHLIRSGVKSFSEFVEKMVAEFTKTIRPHLRKIFTNVQAELGKQEEGAKKKELYTQPGTKEHVTSEGMRDGKRTLTVKVSPKLNIQLTFEEGEWYYKNELGSEWALGESKADALKHLPYVLGQSDTEIAADKKDRAKKAAAEGGEEQKNPKNKKSVPFKPSAPGGVLNKAGRIDFNKLQELAGHNQRMLRAIRYYLGVDDDGTQIQDKITLKEAGMMVGYSDSGSNISKAVDALGITKAAEARFRAEFAGTTPLPGHTDVSEEAAPIDLEDLKAEAVRTQKEFAERADLEAAMAEQEANSRDTLSDEVDKNASDEGEADQRSLRSTFKAIGSAGGSVDNISSDFKKGLIAAKDWFIGPLNKTKKANDGKVNIRDVPLNDFAYMVEQATFYQDPANTETLQLLMDEVRRRQKEDSAGLSAALTKARNDAETKGKYRNQSTEKSASEGESSESEAGVSEEGEPNAESDAESDADGLQFSKRATVEPVTITINGEQHTFADPIRAANALGLKLGKYASLLKCLM